VTLQQVADRAGVSRTTASFVLTGRRDMRISAAAQERVMHASRELNYRPSLVARALMNHRSQTIGLISDQLATEVFAGEAIRGALSTALLREHMLFVGESGGDRQVEVRLVQDMLDRGVVGFVYASLYTRKVTLSPLLRGQPVVLLNCLNRSRGFAAVVPDEIEGGRAAAQLLIEAGHENQIVLVGETPPHILAGVERLSGIQDALGAAGLKLMAQLDTIWWPDEAYQAVTELLASGALPTALICLNDRVAFGAYQAIAEHGLTIPDDISIVSFDDSDLASWIRPHLTSIAIPHFELGRRSVELLLDDNRANLVHRIPMPVFERESVGPPTKRRRNRDGTQRHAS
jgi:LacI family transcriptional regulator